ncbi:hypothetical protein A0J48_016145 [Sphaerospermopsis aphanizomenoides BCCUSP55]|nr:hypothetical protein [Sphaerospermopsis aphanizomenoides BCCUSP55]
MKAVKEDGKPENKATPIPEPDQVKAKAAEEKEASKGKDLEPVDLEPDE